MGDRETTTLRSDGERSVRAYVRMRVPGRVAAPTEPEARVVITDPHRCATLTGPLPGAGPRNAEQMAPPTPKAPGIELPDHRPLNKAQRFLIDPELLLAWEAEEQRKREAV